MVWIQPGYERGYRKIHAYPIDASSKYIGGSMCGLGWLYDEQKQTIRVYPAYPVNERTAAAYCKRCLIILEIEELP